MNIFNVLLFEKFSLVLEKKNYKKLSTANFLLSFFNKHFFIPIFGGNHLEEFNFLFSEFEIVCFSNKIFQWNILWWKMFDLSSFLVFMPFLLILIEILLRVFERKSNLIKSSLNSWFLDSVFRCFYAHFTAFYLLRWIWGISCMPNSSKSLENCSNKVFLITNSVYEQLEDK